MLFPFGRSRGREEPDEPRVRRGPKVGIALSAGAARGWSQIGVFRELLAHGLTPDIVVGTSIGAVVGGCYAAGRLDQIEAFALSLSKRRVFSLMDFSFSGMGLLAGRRLEARLRSELGAFRVEDLPVRFAAVATEVHTGHEVWLPEGPLVPVIRASYALPGLFEPICIDGRWLMDGALVNPIPVSVCRAMGAEVVVAVNLISDTLGRTAEPLHAVPDAPALPALPTADPAVGMLQNWWWHAATGALPASPRLATKSGPGIASVLVDAFNITQDRIARSRLAGDPPDVMINVKCGKVGLFDFHRAQDLIGMGREAADRAMPDLRDYLGHLPRAGAPSAGVPDR